MPSLLTPSPSVPHPSLSRDCQASAPPPHLSHALHELGSSVLSLAADDSHVYSGSQSQDISVWSKSTFKQVETLTGHTGSVLSLEYARDRKWLFSSSGDSTVRVWCTRTFVCLYVINPYMEVDSGDLFSLAWCSDLQTIYIGCQNTSLQWYTFSGLGTDSSTTTGTSTPSRKAHKFFDSFPQCEHRAPEQHTNSSSSQLTQEGCIKATPASYPQAVLDISARNVIDSAHYGYIYCMALIERPSDGSQGSKTAEPSDIFLATGSGDEVLKIWACSKDATPVLKHQLTGHNGAILSLIARKETLYAGCQDGYVKVWDLETKTIVRSIMVQEGIDVLSVSMIQSELYTCSANGQVQRWSASFDCTASWPAHENAIVLSSIITTGQDSDTHYLITGGSDDFIKVWNLSHTTSKDNSEGEDALVEDSKLRSGAMEYALAKFISIPSVSSQPSHREDCRQAAIWLRKCLTQLGAHSILLPAAEGINPLVLATFHGTQTRTTKPRLLFYGHYDVIAAPDKGWDSDPFTLSGRNGYLYGRGASDNKGPILAMAFAAAHLLSQRSLELDLVFLIEGEEECGSRGFIEAVKEHKANVGHIDAVILSNSTWIAEEPPCITYGLRGVVQLSIHITSGQPDMHSGVEGGAQMEPMTDMVKLLATLTDDGLKVQVPGFYDRVRTLTDYEKKLYTRLSAITQLPSSTLSSRWREPSLTVHNIEVSGPRNATVIPGTVKAQISVRIVPDQDLNSITTSLVNHLESSFKSLKTQNEIMVKVERTADWWLGNLEDPWFQSLELAIQDEWGTEPLRIREGGSIPSIPFLEKEFGCHAVHLPIGQSSDQAHLPNERISLTHLNRGKSVMERFIRASAERFCPQA